MSKPDNIYMTCWVHKWLKNRAWSFGFQVAIHGEECEKCHRRRVILEKGSSGLHNPGDLEEAYTWRDSIKKQPAKILELVKR